MENQRSSSRRLARTSLTRVKCGSGPPASATPEPVHGRGEQGEHHPAAQPEQQHRRAASTAYCPTAGSAPRPAGWPSRGSPRSPPGPRHQQLGAPAGAQGAGVPWRRRARTRTTARTRPAPRAARRPRPRPRSRRRRRLAPPGPGSSGPGPPRSGTWPLVIQCRPTASARISGMITKPPPNDSGPTLNATQATETSTPPPATAAAACGHLRGRRRDPAGLPGFPDGPALRGRPVRGRVPRPARWPVRWPRGRSRQDQPRADGRGRGAAGQQVGHPGGPGGPRRSCARASSWGRPGTSRPGPRPRLPRHPPPGSGALHPQRRSPGQEQRGQREDADQARGR